MFDFDEDFCTEVRVKEEKNTICLYLSDELMVVDDLPNLPESFAADINHIINQSHSWYDKAVQVIKHELCNEKPRLMSIYILSEPDNEPLIFGLGFRVVADIEHGRGMKVRADTMEIIDYGLADVAFS